MMQYWWFRLAVLMLAAFPHITLAKDDTEWMQFRGPGGSGVSSQTHPLPSHLNRDSRRWKIDIPKGHSSPIVVQQSIFLTGYEEGKLLVLSIDLLTGNERWRREIPIESFEKTHPQHGPASCTPVSDGHRLFVVFGSYGLLAYDLEGNLLWENKIERHPNLFGSAASPIYVDQRLIVFWGDEVESRLQAVDPNQGNVLWERRRPGPASSWSTPTILEAESGRQILFYEPYHLRACDWEGKDLWSVPGLADEPITVPQVAGGLVYITSYNLRTNTEATGLPTFDALLSECDANHDRQIDSQEARTNHSILSRPDADGQGDHPLRMFFRMLDQDQSGAISEAEWPHIHSWMDPWKHANGLVAIQPGHESKPATLSWQHASGVPECPSPLILNNKIYLIRNGGTITCVRAQDGKSLSQARLAGGGPYYASPIAGDGKLYLASARGQVTVLDTSSEPLRALSINQLDEGIYATPALCDAGLILRSESSLWRFDIDTH